MSVAAEDRDSPKKSRTFDVVYCNRCGMTLHMFTA